MAFGGEVGVEDVLVAIVVEVAGIDAHAGRGLPVAIERHACQQALVPERAVLLVDPEEVGQPVVGDVDIAPPVAVEVRHRDPQGRSELAAQKRRAVTSANVPLPRLRYSRSGCGW